jgi:hypothetical protein
MTENSRGTTCMRYVLDRFTGNLLLLPAEARAAGGSQCAFSSVVGWRRRQVGKAAPGTSSPVDKEEGDGPKRAGSPINPARRRCREGESSPCRKTGGAATEIAARGFAKAATRAGRPDASPSGGVSLGPAAKARLLRGCRDLRAWCAGAATARLSWRSRSVPDRHRPVSRGTRAPRKGSLVPPSMRARNRPSGITSAELSRSRLCGDCGAQRR